MRIDGQAFDERLAELDAEVLALEAAFAQAPARWDRGAAGKWTGGQHAEHLAISLDRFVGDLELAAAEQAAGRLAPRARPGPLHSLARYVMLERGFMPRGARTPAEFEATAHPARATVVARLHAAVDRLRELGRTRTPAQRDALWIANPFLPRWTYSLPETPRIQAVHVRHHRRQIEEIPVA